MEQCLGLEEVPDKRIGNTKNRGKPVEVEGKKFDSQREACRYYNVKEATFIKRKQEEVYTLSCEGRLKINLKGKEHANQKEEQKRNTSL